MGFFFKLRSVAFQAHQQHWFLFYEKSCLYIQFPGFFFSVPQRWNYIRVSKWFPFWGCIISLNWQWLIAALKSFFSKMISHLLPPGKVHQHHLAKLQPHLNQLQYLRKYVNTELAAWVNDFHFWMDQSYENIDCSFGGLQRKMHLHLLPQGKVHLHHLDKLQPHLNQLQYLKKFTKSEFSQRVSLFCG